MHAGGLPLVDLQLRSLPKLEGIALECFSGLAPTLVSLSITECPKVAHLPEDIGQCERLESILVRIMCKDIHLSINIFRYRELASAGNLHRRTVCLLWCRLTYPASVTTPCFVASVCIA